MTLAVAILLFGFSAAPPVTGRDAVSPQSAQQTDTTQPGSTPSIQDSKPQTTTGIQSNPSSSPTTEKPAVRKPAKKRLKKKAQKKAAAPLCDNSTESSANNAAAGATNPQDPTPNQTPKNCPPEKIVVQHGGTAEPSIQLAGGEQAAQKRNETNQMLGSTDENLKKISAIQLNADQQDTVSQIKQFVVESRAALAAGDLERGHTLAWKAQLLSEDLVKPQK